MAADRRHHNCFYYYRGPSRTTAQLQHRQVEDNTTKALINTLEHAGPKLTRSFLARFAPGLPCGDGAATFYLQGRPSALPAGPRRLLGISLLGEPDPLPGPTATEGDTGRVDAAIVTSTGAALAIEVKVVDRLDPDQLLRHAGDWQIEGPFHDGNQWTPPAAWHLARWLDVWHWAATERMSAPAGSVDRFLLDQFAEYLEILGFSAWAGFREEDFIALDSDVAEQFTVARNRVAGLWERVLDVLAPSEAALLGQPRINRTGVKDGLLCVQTNAGARTAANLTFELRGHELQLNLVGWRPEQRNRVIRWLQDAEAVRDAALRGFEVVVFERVPTRDHRGKPFWQRETSHEVWRAPWSDVLEGAFAARYRHWERSLDPVWSAPALHIRRSWPRSVVLEQGESLLHDVVDGARRLLGTAASNQRLELANADGCPVVASPGHGAYPSVFPREPIARLRRHDIGADSSRRTPASTSRAARRDKRSWKSWLR